MLLVFVVNSGGRLFVCCLAVGDIGAFDFFWIGGGGGVPSGHPKHVALFPLPI